ncbi:MAG: hypothetical protein QOD98_3406 [Nocardioidaceae bacterium]|jgi:hypothetical protein|nr:hypothetical protein [Nocardioidaceae bacterium]
MRAVRRLQPRHRVVVEAEVERGQRVLELEETLDKFLMFGQTVTSIVVTTPVPSRPLPIPG